MLILYGVKIAVTLGVDGQQPACSLSFKLIFTKLGITIFGPNFSARFDNKSVLWYLDYQNYLMSLVQAPSLNIFLHMQHKYFNNHSLYPKLLWHFSPLVIKGQYKFSTFCASINNSFFVYLPSFFNFTYSNILINS